MSPDQQPTATAPATPAGPPTPAHPATPAGPPTPTGLPTPYAETVLDLVEGIPAGRVLSYGDVAAMLGTGSARTVGMVLARWGSGVAWHRVVRSDGSSAPAVRARQIALLTAEGTPLAAGGRVDLTTARWSPS